jgi:hypothetical protein
LKRYLGPGVIAAVGGLAFVGMPGLSPRLGDALVGMAWLLWVAGLGAVFVQVVTDPRLARPGAAFAHPAAGLVGLGMVTIAALAALQADVIVSPAFWGAVLAFLVGQAAWIVQLGDRPVSDRAGARSWRVALILLLAAPTLLLGLFVAVAIAVEGDLAWNAAPLIAPALLIAPFTAMATRRALRRPSPATN